MRLRRSTPIALTLALLACSVPGYALRFSVSPGSPFVFIQVGSGELSDYGLLGPPIGQIDTVTFTLPAGVQAGDGTPVVGAPIVPIAFLGYSGGNRTNFSVTMDSSGGLVSQGGDSIPFSDFTWTTQDGDIPAGQFDDSPTQPLLQYAGNGNRARGIVDYLTFNFVNTTIYPAGDYTGRVTYTITEL